MDNINKDAVSVGKEQGGDSQLLCNLLESARTDRYWSQGSRQGRRQAKEGRQNAQEEGQK